MLIVTGCSLEKAGIQRAHLDNLPFPSALTNTQEVDYIEYFRIAKGDYKNTPGICRREIDVDDDDDYMVVNFERKNLWL